jgi:hypothetical protein
VIPRSASNASNDNRCECRIATWRIRRGSRMSEWSSEEGWIYGHGCDPRWKRIPDWMMVNAWELSSRGGARRQIWVAPLWESCESGNSARSLAIRALFGLDRNDKVYVHDLRWFGSTFNEKVILKSVFFRIILVEFYVSRYRTRLCKDNCLYQSKINSERIFQSQSLQLISPVFGFAFCSAGSLIPCSATMRKHWKLSVANKF